MMQPKPQILPVSLPPLGLSREQAADFVGVGTTLFDELVNDGRMPRPKRINKRTVWNRIKIEEAFFELPDDNDSNPWDDELSVVI
jgi:predicted DNA-binding transcriptional regulator AlpA